MVTTKKVVVKTTPPPTYCDTVLNGVGYQTSEEYTAENYAHDEGGKQLTFSIFLGITIVFLLITLYAMYNMRGFLNWPVIITLVLTLVSLAYTIYNKVSMGKVPASWIAGECEIKGEE